MLRPQQPPQAQAALCCQQADPTLGACSLRRASGRVVHSASALASDAQLKSRQLGHSRCHKSTASSTACAQQQPCAARRWGQGAPEAAAAAEAATTARGGGRGSRRAACRRLDAVARVPEGGAAEGLPRRSLVLGGLSAASLAALLVPEAARALVRVELSIVTATKVACPEGQTTVTGGNSLNATGFRITGDAFNPASQPVYNADVFGRVYDAQGEPALDAEENLRIDTLAELPPGKSKVSFQITVDEAQAALGPLELKNFKASGFLGKVNNRQGSGRLDDIDFSELDEDYVPYKYASNYSRIIYEWPHSNLMRSLISW
eukprot:SM000113S24099  [mRNA]  locus=s113:383938:386315:- [translate_table: standard]